MSGLLADLVVATGLSERIIRRIVSTAPLRYKSYVIPKRSGGLRNISQPAREVKLLQRQLVKMILLNLPVHPCATAYQLGSNIKNNALPHAKSGALLKMDLTDFFPSIQRRDWMAYCRDTGCLKDLEDMHVSSQILFAKYENLSGLRLAIGAPSSPILSNILMYEFDKAILSHVVDSKILYTRYADDITFSAPRLSYLDRIERVVSDTIRNMRYPKLRVNDDKTVYVTKRYARRVTGLVLASDGRVTIGRDKKREVRASVHRASLNLLNLSELQKLNGYLAYINSVEPSFIVALIEKYGPDVLKKIKSARC